MRRSFAMPGLATLVTLGALALAGSPGSLASPGEESPSAPSQSGFIGDGPGPLDQDNREGRVEPTARQRGLAAAVAARARFNALGTPAMLTSTGRPLASGLPDDPVAAARAYIAGNREVLGLTTRAANSLQVVTVAPMGDGAAVLLQQQFGNLVAGYDGLLVIGVGDGMVFHVSGSLARDAAQPASAQLSAEEAARIAVRDAGVDRSAVQEVELVAVPTPAGARAAYNVVIIDGDPSQPVAFSSFVDARDGTLLVREDLVDHDTDNPEWEVFPNTPPVDYSSTDTRVNWCFAPGPGCDEVVGTSASPLAWDIDPSNRRPSETTLGNNSFAVHNWFSNDPFSVGKELATPRPARDNANQITPPDGHPPITNMYLWQPIAGAFYAPCVDGDFDMSVIAHEYTHAITNRMIGGPNAGIRGHQGGAMGESWSDLVAMEYLNSNGFVPVAGENPFAVGPYVTGDPVAGIRNYGMNDSPLNYSDVGYDVTGPQVHADGEIWSATNFELRGAIGNQIWRQVMFDAFLLMPSAVSMVDARDAYLAADQTRFSGAHRSAMWDVFARRGFGQGASSNTNADTDPVPSFASPVGSETTVTFDPRDEAGAPVPGAQLFVGHFQAR